MFLEPYKDALSYTATVTTILSFLTGGLICRDIYYRGNAKEVSGFPFLAGIFGTSLWLRYGLFLGDEAMSRVNSIGAALQLTYCLFYWFYATNKAKFFRQLSLLLIVIGCIYTYVTFEPNYKDAKFRLGLLCSSTTIIFCAAPLASLGVVVRNKSTETLPFYMILANVLVTGQWFLYGVIIQDPFVQVPNLVGCLIAGIQLALFAVYPSKSRVL